MTDEMTTITEILPATGEIKQREISKKDYEELFSGMKVTTVGPSVVGTFTHTINPGGPPPPDPAITPEEFAEMYREQLRTISPAGYQRMFLGMQSWEPFAVPSGGFLEELPEPERMPKPNVWERLKTWLTEAQTQTVEVTRSRAARRIDEDSYVAALCTAHRNAITGSPRRGGRQMGRQFAAAVIHEDYNQMIREGSGLPSSVLAAADAGTQAAALRSEVGSFNSFRIVRSMPGPGEAEAKWQQNTNVGELHV